MGVVIFEQSRVTDIFPDGVVTNGFSVHAHQILLCTDRLLPQLDILKHDIYHVQTFLGITKPLDTTAAKKLFPDTPLMVWDTDLIYQYFRLTGDNRLMIGAASLLYSYVPKEIHESNITEQKLENYLAKKFPWLEMELEYLWPGLIGTSKDFVPIAAQDEHQKNLFYMSAATGVPWAASVGNYIAEKMISGRSDFDQDFTPKRTYPLSRIIQTILRKPITFAASHGLIKYFQ